MTQRKPPLPPELLEVFGPVLEQMIERTDLHHLLPPKQRRLIEVLIRERERAAADELPSEQSEDRRRRD